MVSICKRVLALEKLYISYKLILSIGHNVICKSIMSH